MRMCAIDHDEVPRVVGSATALETTGRRTLPASADAVRGSVWRFDFCGSRIKCESISCSARARMLRVRRGRRSSAPRVRRNRSPSPRVRLALSTLVYRTRTTGTAPFISSARGPPHTTAPRRRHVSIPPRTQTSPARATPFEAARAFTRRRSDAAAPRARPARRRRSARAPPPPCSTPWWARDGRAARRARHAPAASARRR